jgi:hypothetical protein
MPTISMFYGIIIRMYFAPGEHNPPIFMPIMVNLRDGIIFIARHSLMAIFLLARKN